jgi:hypothetical protein
MVMWHSFYRPVELLGCWKVGSFTGASAVRHVPLSDEILHHRPKTADSRPIANKQGGKRLLFFAARGAGNGPAAKSL